MALELRDITVRIGGRDILRDCSVSFPAGAVTAVLGPNGAGKSTLLRTIIGIVEPSTGTMRIGGMDAESMSPRQRRNVMAYVAQRSSVEFDFTARDVVAFAHYGERIDTVSVEDALCKTGLSALADRRFDELSVGQQQRTSIARALAQIGANDHDLTGKILLADEPVASLDPAHAIVTLECMRNLANKGAAVIIVMHDLSTALRFADRVVVIDASGCVAGAGTPEEVLRTRVIQRVYDIELKSADSSVVVPVRTIASFTTQGTDS